MSEARHAMIYRDAMYQWAWGVIQRGEIKPEKFSREALAELLQWNDRNGCYLDDLTKADGMPPITKQEAIDCVKRHTEEA